MCIQSCLGMISTCVRRASDMGQIYSRHAWDTLKTCLRKVFARFQRSIRQLLDTLTLSVHAYPKLSCHWLLLLSLWTFHFFENAFDIILHKLWCKYHNHDHYFALDMTQHQDIQDQCQDNILSMYERCQEKYSSS